MTTPQSAILPAASPHALFMTLALADGAAAARRARAVLAEVAARTDAQNRLHPEGRVLSAASIGSVAWPRIFGAARPAELAPFPAIEAGERRAPATPGDLFLHLRAERADLAFELGRALLVAFGDAVRVVEEVAGFRYLDGHDLTGFVDGTENPEGDERAEVALVGAEDAAFAGGSYVSTQRYVHDLARWATLDVAEQERVIGRTKADDVELDDDAKPPTAHIARVVIEDDGEELAILRHSMPYGVPSEAGLQFLAYGATPRNFDRMLARMMGVGDEAEGVHDRLMEFSRAVTGGRFFAPSLEDLSG